MAHQNIKANPIYVLKTHRLVAVKYLEPQYKRIVDSATAMGSFIRKQQQPGGKFSTTVMLSPESELFSQYAVEGINIANKYAAAVHRDAPLWIKAQIRGKRPYFNNTRFQKCQREVNLRRLSVIMQSGNMAYFLRAFGTAYLNLNQQYRKVCTAGCFHRIPHLKISSHPAKHMSQQNCWVFLSYYALYSLLTERS